MHSNHLTRRLSLALGLNSLLFSTVVGGTNRPHARTAIEIPQVRHGRLERLQGLPWRHVVERPVEVWLPPDYEALKAAGTRFAVLYMNDGQMLWDASTTWNKQAWHVDQTLTRLMHAGSIPPTLVVGLWNAGEHRHSEYFPE